MNIFTVAKSKRPIVIAILATGVVAMAFIVWFIAATQYQSVVDHWIDYGRANGYEITWERREQFGFPRRAVLRFVNLNWKDADGIGFHADDLDITAALGETKVFTAKFKGKVEIDVPVDANHNVILGGEGGQAHVTLADDGSWAECHLTMQAARFGRTPDYVVNAVELKISALRPPDPPPDVKTPGLIMSGEATDVILPDATPQSFGLKMAHLKTDLRVMGDVPDFRKKDSVAAWNKNFGVVNFDKLDMEWGTLLLTSKGTMGFDDDLQPEGAFDATIGRQDELLATLMKDGFIAPTQQEMLSSAMKLFAKPSPIKGQSGVEVPVAVQLGGLFLGPVKIFAFPQIVWE